MNKLIIFGGTSEGRRLAEFATEEGIPTLVSVATDYGVEQLTSHPSLDILSSRLSEVEMAILFQEKQPTLVIDATHPHAYEVGQNILRAANETKTKLLRVKRDSKVVPGAHYFETLEDMLSFVSQRPGIIFSGLGLKSAEALTALPNFKKRVIIRVLPDSQGLITLENLGYPRKHIIAMQGPFDSALNRAMYEAKGANILLSKDSGWQGGLLEKVLPAQDLNMEVCLLRMPEEHGFSVEEIQEKIREVFNA